MLALPLHHAVMPPSPPVELLVELVLDVDVAPGAPPVDAEDDAVAPPAPPVWPTTTLPPPHAPASRAAPAVALVREAKRQSNPRMRDLLVVRGTAQAEPHCHAPGGRAAPRRLTPKTARPSSAPGGCASFPVERLSSVDGSALLRAPSPPAREAVEHQVVHRPQGAPHLCPVPAAQPRQGERRIRAQHRARRLLGVVRRELARLGPRPAAAPRRAPAPPRGRRPARSSPRRSRSGRDRTRGRPLRRARGTPPAGRPARRPGAPPRGDPRPPPRASPPARRRDGCGRGPRRGRPCWGTPGTPSPPPPRPPAPRPRRWSSAGRSGGAGDPPLRG